jgi:hypothetical protein
MRWSIARVTRSGRSEPALGLVRLIETLFSPEQTLGIIDRRCLSVPAVQPPEPVLCFDSLAGNYETELGPVLRLQDSVKAGVQTLMIGKPPVARNLSLERVTSFIFSIAFASLRLFLTTRTYWLSSRYFLPAGLISQIPRGESFLRKPLSTKTLRDHWAVLRQRMVSGSEGKGS